MQVNAFYTQISINRRTSDCKDVYVTNITVEPHWVHKCQHGGTLVCYFDTLSLHAPAQGRQDDLHIWMYIGENDNYSTTTTSTKFRYRSHVGIKLSFLKCQ